MNGIKGLIFEIERFAIHDGPGIRTVIYLKGCPLQCAWCANPEGQRLLPEIMIYERDCIKCYRCTEECPKKLIRVREDKIILDRKECNSCGLCTQNCPAGGIRLVGKYMDEDEALKEVEKDQPFYRTSNGGVTLSGGEPTMQSEFAISLLKELQRRRIHTAIETCGYLSWQDLERMLKYVDLILYDLKHMDAKKHERYTSVDNKTILENLRKTRELNIPIVVRFPLVPGFNDSCENVHKLGRFCNNIGVEKVDILPYHNYGESKYTKLGRKYPLQNLKPPSKKEVSRISNILCSYNLKIRDGGGANKLFEKMHLSHYEDSTNIIR